MQTHRTKKPLRRGSFMLEVVVASALFATAVLALGRLAQNASSLSNQADQRLSSQLTAENTLARLRTVPFEKIESESQRVATVISKESGLAVAVSVETFSVDESVDESATEHSAAHLIVRVGPDDSLSNVPTPNNPDPNNPDPNNTASETAAPDTVRPDVTLHDWRFEGPAQ